MSCAFGGASNRYGKIEASGANGPSRGCLHTGISKTTSGGVGLAERPSFSDLTLSEERERLSLRVGDQRADELLRGLRDIRRGEGDYSLAPTEKGVAPPIWFWWMPWSGRR
jgi:hypothetical protein